MAIASVSHHFKLNKALKLRHRTLVNSIFANGNGAYAFPLRMMWQALTEQELHTKFPHGVPPKIGKVQFMLTVPKKKQRRAVDRVLLRRRMREAFRLLRPGLDLWCRLHPEVRSLQLAFVYISAEKVEFSKIYDRMQRLLSEVFAIEFSKNEENI